MFLSEMAEAKQTMIEIRDFDGDAIEDLVKFVYSSRITLTVDNVQPLLYAACILQVELVARACCEYMKLHFHPSNCLAVRAFAESHNRIDLMEMADQYACEHFSEVVECEDFVSVSPQHLHKLLSSSDLNIDNEKQVYNAAIKWLLANPQHHSKWLDETLAQVGAEIRLSRNELYGSKSTCFICHEKCKLLIDVIQCKNDLLFCLVTILFKDRSKFVTFELEILSAF